MEQNDIVAVIPINSQIAASVVDIRELEFIRPTSLKDFDECPDRWRVKYMEGMKQSKTNQGTAAQIGTAVHNLIEMQLRALHQPAIFDFNEVDFKREYAKVPKAESDALMEYLRQLPGPEDMELLGVEFEFQLAMIPGMPPIRGHIDAVFRDKEANIVVLDHKTNRGANDVTWWAGQLQPQIYAWAARKMFEGRSVDFRIGYVNLGYNLQWNVTAQDDARLERRIGEMWLNMVTYSHDYSRERIEYPGAHWPRRITEGCRWCPIKESCIDYKTSMSNFARSFEEKREQLSLSEQIAFADAVEKIAAAKKEELQGMVRQRVELSSDGTFDDGKTTWQIVQKEQRKIEASHLMGMLGALLKDGQLDVQTYTDFLDVIFSAKVTGVDKLLKAKPQLKPIISDIVQMVPVGNGTLVGHKNDRLIGGTQAIGAADQKLKEIGDSQ